MEAKTGVITTTELPTRLRK